jgi:hypothetical protein
MSISLRRGKINGFCHTTVPCHLVFSHVWTDVNQCPRIEAVPFRDRVSNNGISADQVSTDARISWLGHGMVTSEIDNAIVIPSSCHIDYSRRSKFESGYYILIGRKHDTLYRLTWRLMTL